MQVHNFVGLRDRIKELVKPVAELKVQDRRLNKRSAGNKSRKTNTMDERSAPLPLRCRGVPAGDGEYAGCPYGNGDLTPLTGPCDCPSVAVPILRAFSEPR
jgi:hypothetical protein